MDVDLLGFQFSIWLLLGFHFSILRRAKMTEAGPSRAHTHPPPTSADTGTLSHKETVVKHGAEQVQVWRRSFDIPPPPLEKDEKARGSEKWRLAKRLLWAFDCI